MEVELFAYKDGYAGTHFKELRPATDEEIKASHPKCGECKHISIEHPTTTLFGTVLNICPKEDWIVPDVTKDYCRHWEAK